MGLNTTTGRLVFILMLFIVGIILCLLASPYFLVALAFACAMAGALLLIRFPTLAYYTILVMVPFGSFRHLYAGGVEIKLDWIAAGVLIIGIVAHHVVHRRINENLKSPLWLPLSLFFGVSLVAAFLSHYPDVAFNDIKLLAVSYILIMLTLFFVDRHGFVNIMPALIAGSIGLSAFLGLIGYLFSIPSFATIEGPFRRALGGTNDANALSMVIVFGVPFLGYLLLRTRRWSLRILLIGVLLSCLGAKVLTFSRGGAALLVITIVAFIGMHRKRLNARNLGLFMGIGGIMVACALVAIPQEYWERQKALTSDTDQSVSRRITYLYVAADSFIHAPLLGHGPGTFPYLYAKSDYSRRFARTPEDRYRQAHNTYVEVLSGTGAIGLLLFGIIIVMALRDFGKAATTADEHGDNKLAELIRTYRLSFAMLLCYMLIYSDFQNKHMLISIALSQIALRVASEKSEKMA